MPNESIGKPQTDLNNMVILSIILINILITILMILEKVPGESVPANHVGRQRGSNQNDRLNHLQKFRGERYKCK